MEDGGLFWILMAVVGVIVLGGALAMSLVREREPSEEELAETDRATRRLYAEEARESAR